MKDNTNVKILNYDVNWLEIKDACMQTISKEAKGEPPKEWRRKLLICQHSPIRRGVIKWKMDVPFYVHAHMVRHGIGTNFFVATSRSDRTEIKDRSERKQTDIISMQMDANIQALINISAKRLCLCSDQQTIKYWKAVLEAIKEYDEDIYWACVPQCVRCGSCVEPFGKCEFYKGLMTGHTLEEQQDIMKRYDIYNEHREKVKIKKL
jgi:hypothetical protein